MNRLTKLGAILVITALPLFALTTKTGLNILDSVINRTPIGQTTPAAGAFTAFNASSAAVSGNQTIGGTLGVSSLFTAPTGNISTLNSTIANIGSATISGNGTVSGIFTTPTGNITTLNGTTATVSGTAQAGTLSDGTCSINGGHLSSGCHFATATPRTCNANGCYKIDSDGTITESGEVFAPTGGGAVSGTITFPFTFTSVPIITLTAVGNTGGGDTDTPPSVGANSKSTSGISYYMARVIQAGAGGGTFANSTPLDWTATGN